MSVERVALCEECHSVWMPVDEERWQAYWIDEGPDEKLVFYCPKCGEREFGESVSAAFGLTSSSSFTGHRTLDLG